MCEKPQNNDSQFDQVQSTVNEFIRPSLQSHGGDIEIVDLKDNVLTIKYQGACGGCPGAAMGTLNMIQGVLQDKGHAEITVKMA